MLDLNIKLGHLLGPWLLCLFRKPLNSSTDCLTVAFMLPTKKSSAIFLHWEFMLLFIFRLEKANPCVGFFFNFLLQYVACIPSQRWLCCAAMWQFSDVPAEFVNIQGERFCVDTSCHSLQCVCNEVVALSFKRINCYCWMNTSIAPFVTSFSY